MAWGPGQATELLAGGDAAGVVTVSGLGHTGATGQVIMPAMTQTSPTGSVSLVQLVVDFVLPYHDALPRDAVYASGQSAADLAANQVAQIETQRAAAIVAGLRQAGVTVTEVPQVVSVRQSGPSYKRLEVGDLIVAIDGKPMANTDEVRDAIQAKAVGAAVVVTVDRGGDLVPLSINLVGSTNDGTVPTLGVVLAMGYSYPARVAIGLDPASGGPAQGLPLALAVALSADPDDLAAGRVVGAVGTITPDGVIGAVDGIDEYARSAQLSGASLFFIPRDACPRLTQSFATMQIIAVDTLDEVIGWLSLGSVAAAPAC